MCASSCNLGYSLNLGGAWREGAAPISEPSSLTTGANSRSKKSLLNLSPGIATSGTYEGFGFNSGDLSPEL